MLTRIINLISVVMLLGIGAFWHYASNDSLVFHSVVCASGMIAVYHAIRAEQHLWAWGLLSLALLFNPVLPLLRPPGSFSLVVMVLSVAVFAISSTAFKVQQRLSFPSITHGSFAVRSL
jgi:hypothetical protein